MIPLDIYKKIHKINNSQLHFRVKWLFDTN